MSSVSAARSAKSAFLLETRADGVAFLWLDCPDQRVNTLYPGLEQELTSLVHSLAHDPAILGVVLASRKDNSFVAGADIDHIISVTQADEASRISRALSQALGQLELLSQQHHKPVVAAIDGPCLGGGLELALACSHRVVTDNPKTVLGLPEVKLGLIPGGGGTQRLPHQIGVTQALDMILTGKNVRPSKALALKLVDQIVPKSVLLEAAGALALRAAKESQRPAKKPALLARLGLVAKKAQNKDAWQALALERNPLGLKVLFHQARSQLHKTTHGNFPAPARAIDAIERGVTRGMTQGLELEAQAFGQLAVGSEARALLGLYTASQALKKDRGTLESATQPRTLGRVGVLGGGLMGAGIAAVTALEAGINTRIKEIDDRGVSRGLKQVWGTLGKEVAKKRRPARETTRTFRRLTGSESWQGFANIDLVIEAVFEDLTLKRRMLAEVEAQGPEHVIFASNTSSLPISEIAREAKRPEQVIGMHYFSPVEKMPLLEVITHAKTADWVTATTVALGKAQGKTVIVVRDGPGFYTTRILAPYLMEAAAILQEGVSIEAIDKALVQKGFPVGPITLMDEVGLDTGAKVSHVMHEAFGERIPIPAAVEQLIDDKRLGRKNGRGFYSYAEGKKGRVDASVYKVLGVSAKSHLKMDAEVIAERILLQMVNEAAYCLGEGILRSARDGDIGAIFGLGFPPFLGGPFAYIDQVGAKEVVRRLDALAERYGTRFAPAPLLRKATQTNAKLRA